MMRRTERMRLGCDEPQVHHRALSVERAVRFQVCWHAKLSKRECSERAEESDRDRAANRHQATLAARMRLANLARSAGCKSMPLRGANPSCRPSGALDKNARLRCSIGGLA